MRFEQLEGRRVLAASLGWDGPGQGGADLTYYVANSPGTLTREETVGAIEQALHAWASVADITFTQVDTPGLANSLDFSFKPIDGSGGTLAQAYFPDDINPSRIAGDVQFDSSERWEVGNSQGSAAFDLVWVAVHEIGHALGLDHLHSSNSILAPSVSPQQSFTSLTRQDTEAILQLYAPAVPNIDPSETPDSQSTIENLPPVENLPPSNNGSDTIPFTAFRWQMFGSWRAFGGRWTVHVMMHNFLRSTELNVGKGISKVNLPNATVESKLEPQAVDLVFATVAHDATRRINFDENRLVLWKRISSR